MEFFFKEVHSPLRSSLRLGDLLSENLKIFSKKIDNSPSLDLIPEHLHIFFEYIWIDYRDAFSRKVRSSSLEDQISLRR